MSSASAAYSVSMPAAPTPPSDLSSYARYMHQHTKRQMEAFGTYPEGSRRSANRDRVTPTMPNGISSRSTVDSDDGNGH